MPGFTQIPNEWVFDDPLWTSEKFTKGQAYCDLYRLAQFQPGIVQKRGIIIELRPGQLGWSQAELVKRWDRSLGWVRRLLNYLEKAGHIVVQKTNVSSTITLLHWVQNGTTNDIANGKQTVQQKDSKRYTNNIVNKENTANKENTPMGVDDLVNEDIMILWQRWINEPNEKPFSDQLSILKKALLINSAEFWIEQLNKRNRVLNEGGSSPNNMKYWFNGGYREMIEKKSNEKGDFKKAPNGGYIAYCSKCGNKEFPKDDYQLRAGSNCCRVDYNFEKPIYEK